MQALPTGGDNVQDETVERFLGEVGPVVGAVDDSHAATGLVVDH